MRSLRSDRTVRVVALALDSGQLAVAPLGHDVDAIVAAVASRPLVPAPDRTEAVAVLAIGAKYLRNERLEPSPALPRIGVALAEVRVDIAEGCWHEPSQCGSSAVRLATQVPPRAGLERAC